LCGAVLCGIGVSEVQAGFINYYAPDRFTLMNYGGGTDETGTTPTANGTASFLDWETLVLTGTNDGSGVEGWTDLTVPAAATGWLRFHYSFGTEDDPTYEYAGYLIDSSFYFLADTDGDSGLVEVPVVSGQVFGFRAGSYDSQGGLQGALTITDFSAPTPEPGTLSILAILGAATLGVRWLLPRRKRPS
jgi:hypothetical protein